MIIYRLSLSKLRRSIMEAYHIHNLAWYKPWPAPMISKDTNDLLKQCALLPRLEPSSDLQEIIRQSNAFPIPFPIETVRMHKLIEKWTEEDLKKNVKSSYPLIHERVLLMMIHFLMYKRQYGSTIEKTFYKNMTVPELIDRILKKRAVVFMYPDDEYLLLNGKSGVDGWESIGTEGESTPLCLADCLSYDELKLAAMVYVSGSTVCINSGERTNAGCSTDEGEPLAVIIGIVGPRFERDNRMDCEDIVINRHQNTPTNGYASENGTDERRKWREMWSQFYQAPSYEELSPTVKTNDDPEKKYSQRFLRLTNGDIFDNELYFKRLAIIVESSLFEAEERGKEEGKMAFLNVIGAGLGVWRISEHQRDVYVLTWIQIIRELLKKDTLHHVSDVNFAYIRPSGTVQELFTTSTGTDDKTAKISQLFLESKNHPQGGINVHLKSREPSAKLIGEHAGKLLIMTYPWDGNAHPGNEFWLGSLVGSGDPAAACSTQVAELHNAHINSNICAANTRVVTDIGLVPLSEFCAKKIALN